MSLVLLVLTALLACQVDAKSRQREVVVGGPCEGCEAVFVGRPDSVPSTARIAPENEPGEPMVIMGTVFNLNGEVAPGVIVYAYQTNELGIYPMTDKLRGTEAYAHGRLRAWARSDEAGRYQFNTIRPGAYPGGSNPQHVHMHVLEVGCCTYYLSSIKFTDDPLLTAEEREQAKERRGGYALVTPSRNEHGVWLVNRDVYLGRGIPGYPGGSPSTP
jgi:protocatechuate 3,4-dioxygenase beta subunit